MHIRLYQKFLFASLSLIYMLPFIQGVIMTVTAKDIMHDMRLSPDRMGMIGASFLCSYAASMFASGMLAAYFGPRLTMAGMFLIAGVGGVLFSVTDSFPLLCLGRALTGVGTAICLSCSFTLFSRWYKGEDYARICAVFFCVGGMGALLGASPLALVNSHWGWRSCFLIVAVLTLAYAALAFFAIRDWPPPGSEKELGITPAPRERPTLALIRDSVAKASKSRDFWRLAIWFVGLAGMYQAFVGLWAVPYYKDVFGFHDAPAGILLSLFSLGFIIGNPLLGWLVEHKIHSNRIPLGASGIACLLGFAPLYLGGDRLTYVEHILIALLLGMAMNAPNTLIYASARNLFGARISGMISGVMAGISLVAGAATQMLVSGLLAYAQRKGMPPLQAYLFAFSPFFGCCAVMMLCGFTLTRASDPGRISPMSWRMIRPRGEEEAQ